MRKYFTGTMFVFYFLYIYIYVPCTHELKYMYYVHGFMLIAPDSSIQTSYELNTSIPFSVRTVIDDTSSHYGLAHLKHNKNVVVLRSQLTAERKSENRNRYHLNTHCPPPIFLQTRLLTATDLPGSAVLFSITD
jgi:hypothetical protein